MPTDHIYYVLEHGFFYRTAWSFYEMLMFVLQLAQFSFILSTVPLMSAINACQCILYEIVE